MGRYWAIGLEGRRALEGKLFTTFREIVGVWVE